MSESRQSERARQLSEWKSRIDELNTIGVDTQGVRSQLRVLNGRLDTLLWDFDMIADRAQFLDEWDEKLLKLIGDVCALETNALMNLECVR